METYQHLSDQERENISRDLCAGESFRAIARKLGRHHGTLSRELSRNAAGDRHAYRALDASAKARERQRIARRPRFCDERPALWQDVQTQLVKGKSPEQIAGRLKVDHPDDPMMHVSHETIYRAIYILPRGRLRQELTACLRRRHRKRRKRGMKVHDRRGQIPNLVPISARPRAVETRKVPGHLEGDLIVGRNHKSALLSIVERTSRKIFLAKTDGLDSASVIRAVRRKIGRLPAHLRLTLTYDRGKEMSQHEKLRTSRLRLAVFFCDPQSPWQRGTNENTNGLVREYFPKGMDFTAITAAQVRLVEHRLNDRPRKCLAFATPNEVFSSYLVPSGALET